jgi:hypothetical protein
MSDDQTPQPKVRPGADEQLTSLEPSAGPAAPREWRPAAEVLDAELAPRRVGRQVAALTAALVTVIVAVAAFAGGVLVQRGRDGTTPVAAAASGRGSTGGGTGAEGGAGRFGSGGQGRAFGGVTGTVVSVRPGTLVVARSDGTRVTVAVPNGVTVTKSTSVPLTSLARGSTVSVVGGTGSDGVVTARAVVAGELGAGLARGGFRPGSTGAPTTSG